MYWNNRVTGTEINRHNAENGQNRVMEFDAISIMSSKRCAKVPIKDIEAIEQEGRKLHIITGDDDFTCYEKIDRIAPLLLNKNFFRPMKSLIVNFDNVKEVSGQEVEFISGQSISMGKNNLTKLRMAYKRFLKNYPPFSQTIYNSVAEDDSDYTDV